MSREMLAAIDNTLDLAPTYGFVPEALMLSLDAWAKFKRLVPRNQYRKRVGTKFINAYRGVPIELHDEWAWGWNMRPDRPDTQQVERAA